MTKITEEVAATVKGMIARGDRQMDIATYCGINQARVAEIRLGKGAGKKFRHVAPKAHDLPSPGPYVVVSKASYDEMQMEVIVHQRLVSALEELLSALRAKV